ncbi:hypothetical protein HRR83_003150 [Exophiala dermatitidis]|uniref:Uncharacterized protein n=1 Tax=Exophiala dermatitidis TaxID=5970 RepID=A0AAN6IR53_EXODE|nr:hypothetical protein HRR75_007533 [Exophiala dermatitidis]KAJ4506308.1 hypothetical protein HRR73_008106 [Exophiala dermatitidis]KAJ4506889.1 hypothetical protein HRR74_008205 [Exophiala dermatitidis]KAJ4547890.1 hypothetical protein HRR76_000511 [Exophiala dermatitidis]KAJ4553830.1 hypothetical protein HRR77_002201 [Exophiala dermatitidis]
MEHPFFHASLIQGYGGDMVQPSFSGPRAGSRSRSRSLHHCRIYGMTTGRQTSPPLPTSLSSNSPGSRLQFSTATLGIFKTEASSGVPLAVWPNQDDNIRNHVEKQSDSNITRVEKNQSVMISRTDFETHRGPPLQLPLLLHDPVPANPQQEGDESPLPLPFHPPSRLQTLLRRTPTSYDLRAVAHAQRHGNSHVTPVKRLLPSPIPKGSSTQNDDEWQRYIVNRKWNDDYLSCLQDTRQSCSYSCSYKRGTYDDCLTVAQKHPLQQESNASSTDEELEDSDTNSEADSSTEDDAQLLSYYYNESGRLPAQVDEKSTGSTKSNETVVVGHTGFAQKTPKQAQADELGHQHEQDYESVEGDTLGFDDGRHKSAERVHHSGYQNTSGFYEDEGGTVGSGECCSASSPLSSTDSVLEPSTPPTPLDLNHDIGQCRNHRCNDYEDGNGNDNVRCDLKRARNREAVAFCSSDESGWLANTTSHEERRRRFKARLCQVVQRPWTAELRYNHCYGYGCGTDCENGDRDEDEGLGVEGTVMIATLLIGIGPGKPKLIQIQRPASSSSRTSSTEPSSSLISNRASDSVLVSRWSTSLDTRCPPTPLGPIEPSTRIETDLGTPTVSDSTSGSGSESDSNSQRRVRIDLQQLSGAPIPTFTGVGRDNGRADVAVATNPSIPVTAPTLASFSISAASAMSSQSVQAVEGVGAAPPSTPVRASKKVQDHVEVSAFSPYDTPGGADDYHDYDEDVGDPANVAAEFDNRSDGHGYHDGDVFAGQEPGSGLYCLTDMQPQALRYVTYT